MSKSSVIYVEKSKCDICGNSCLEKILECEDYDTNLGRFNILKCTSCSACFTSPIPTEDTLKYLYDKRGSKNFDEGKQGIFDRIKNYIAKKEIKRYLKNSCPESIADFGTGNGRYAAAMKVLYKNSQVFAVDFSKEPPPELAGNKDVIYITVEKFFNSEKNYDVIFLRHVLEHVYNPQYFIKLLYEKLNPHGKLIIEVPNIDSAISKIFGKYSNLYYPPYHLTHFTKKSFQILLKNYQYTLFESEMPYMSNNLANLFNKKLNNKFRLLGMMLHPFQILINKIYGSKSTLNAIIEKIEKK